MSHTKGDNRTALKLINKYADSHNLLIEENKALKAEIKDLRANIRINKEIIEGFFNKTNSKDRQQLLLTKSKEETEKLYKQNETLSKDLNALHQRLVMIEQTHSEALGMEKDENESLKMRLFALEQTMIKKDNIIRLMKKKVSNQKEEDFGYIEREIYIAEPSKAIVFINDELLMYKEIYENLVINIKDSRDSLMKSEAMVYELQKENSKLKLQFKYQQICANREKETLLNAVQHDRCLSNTRNVTDKSTKSAHSINNPGYRTIILTDDNLLYKKIKLSTSNEGHESASKYDNKEFNEILKQTGLSQMEYEKLSRIKACAKLVEIVEMMYSLLTDKKMTLNLLKQENEKLTAKNFQLNKDNMVLFQQNIDMKQQMISKQPNNKHDKASDDDSLIANTSQLTGNLQINTALMTYHKLIKAEEKNGYMSGTLGDECDVDSSRHDSIVYTRNMKEDSSVEAAKKAQRDKKAVTANTKPEEDVPIKNQPLMTLESVTSSEFRDGCQGINSFVITIRENSSQDTVGEGKLTNVNIKSTNL